MADVELRLIAQTDEYTSGIRQAQQANQSLYSQSVEGAKREKRSIEEIRQEMGRLRTARNQSSDPKAQEVYNRKIREAGVHLKESQGNLKKYNEELKKGEQVTQKATKSTNFLRGGMAKLMGAVGGVYGAYRILEKVIASTKHTADAMATTKAGLSAQASVLAKAIATLDFKGLADRMINAGRAAREYQAAMNDLGDGYRSLKVETSFYREELAALEMAMRETSRPIEERRKALEDFKKIQLELASTAQALAEEELRVTKNKIATAVKLEGEQLEAMVLNYNKNKKLREDLLAFQKDINNKSIEFEKEHGKVITGANGEIFYDLTEQQKKQYKDEMMLHTEYWQGRTGLTEEQMNEELTNIKKYNDNNDKELDELSASMEKFYQAKAQYNESIKMLNRVTTTLDNEQRAADKAIETKILADKEKFLAEIAKLEDSAEQQRIAGLEGIERIEAEKQYQIEQLEAVEAQLAALGELEAHHYAMLAQMRGVIYSNALAQEVEYWQNKEAIQDAKNEEERKKLEEEAKALQDLQNEVNIAELSLLNDNGAARLAYLIQQKQEEQALLMEAGDEASLLKARLLGVELTELQTEWAEAVGITEEGIGLYVDALKTAYNEITNVLSAIFAEQVSHWQRERGLLDTRIAETQRALDQEIAINQQGYASNIALKQKELEELQAQRELALAEEEKAIKKQQTLDTISQVSSLITASAGIFNSLKALGPVGVGIAIATIATMFGAFAKVKIDAAKATKLAKGGSGSKTGMVTGATHSQGGEAFTDQIEVERGENWGVLAANKVPKYGKMFHQMVEAMNGDKFELSKYIPKPAGIVLNNTNNYTALENELKGLRKDIKNQATVHSGNGYRIEKTGNKTRKIRTK